MTYAHTLAGTRYVFDDLRTLLARATPFRSGDALAGVAAASAAERVAAQMALADVPLATILDEPMIPYETDEVTRLIVDSHDATAFAPVAVLTVGEFREWLLRCRTGGADRARARPDAGDGGRRQQADAQPGPDRGRRQVPRRHALSQHDRPAGRLSMRLQPNHPTDDPRGIAASILDGLLLRLRRRGDRHQPGHRQRRCRIARC